MPGSCACSRGSRFSRREREFREILVSTVRYLRAVLRDPQTRLFAGSQDADEAYFALPRDERAAREVPFVDRTSYTNWTCGLAGAWFYAARALDDDAMMAEASATLDAVHERLHRLRRPRLSLRRSRRNSAGARTPDGPSRISARSARRARNFRRTPFPRARAHAGRPNRHAFRSRGRRVLRPLTGGSRTRTLGHARPPDRRQRRRGRVPAAPERAHPGAALSRPSGRDAGGLRAHLRVGRNVRRRLRARAAPLLLSPELSVRIVGSPEATDDFREAAMRLPTAALAVRTLSPADAAAADLPGRPNPAAYVCLGTACGAPVLEPGGLRDAYDRLAAARTP